MSANALRGLVEDPGVRCIPGGGGSMTGDAEARPTLAGLWTTSGLRNGPALGSCRGGGNGKERCPSEVKEPKR